MVEQAVSPQASPQVPAGLTLVNTLRGHTNIIYEVAWSPDGRKLASASADKTVGVWDAESGRRLHEGKGHRDFVFSVAWSCDGHSLASGSFDQTVRLWDSESGKLLQTLPGHHGPILSVAWSPDGCFLASGSFDQTIRVWQSQDRWARLMLEGHHHWILSMSWSPDGRLLASGSRDKTIGIWDTQRGILTQTLKGHNQTINSVAWSPDGRYLASGADDPVIRLWNVEAGQQVHALEGHTGHILSVRFSPDGRLLGSKSADGTVRLWRCDTWENVAVLDEPVESDVCGGLAFHPQLPILATLGKNQRTIRLWRLDYDILLGQTRLPADRPYRNVKVVLVGDKGVGKTGLALALSGQPWELAQIAQGCPVCTLLAHTTTLPDGRQETREILLWDQETAPGYRLTNQLHLDDTAVALVVFNGRSETKPFAGLGHWNRALEEAQQLGPQESAVPMKKFLVSTFADQGGVPVSQSRIEATIREMGFDGYFEVSAKAGWQIPELATAIQTSIDWKAVPQVQSYDLYQAVCHFLMGEKAAGRVLVTADDLFRLFEKAHPNFQSDTLQEAFNTCLACAQNQNLICRLGFERQVVLLQPELLDTYAAALINAAKSEPDGLGFIAEVDALAGRFPIPPAKRVVNRPKEKLLLAATIEELLRHRIALKEVTKYGTDLVFPSQFSQDRLDGPEMHGKAEMFTFEGPALSIYATLAVRLSRSRLFSKKEMWKHAVTYVATAGGVCGLFLRELREDLAELTLFFDEKTSEVTRYQFADFIAGHLESRAVPGSVYRQRIVICSKCGEPIPDSIIKHRRERGHTSMDCPVCENPISLLDREEYMLLAGAKNRNGDTAYNQRHREIVAAMLKNKLSMNDADVFLCYNDEDELAVQAIRKRLEERGIVPWQPAQGKYWPAALAEDIAHIRSVAVFIGKGQTPWGNRQTAAFLQRFVRLKRGPLILVFLPGTQYELSSPESVLWVDLRHQKREALNRLAQLIKSKGPSMVDRGRRKISLVRQTRLAIRG